MAIQAEIKCPSGNARKHSHAHAICRQLSEEQVFVCNGGEFECSACEYHSPLIHTHAGKRMDICRMSHTYLHHFKHTYTLSHTHTETAIIREWVYEIQLSRKLALRTERTRYCSRLCIYAPATSTTNRPHMHTFVPPTLYAYYSSVAIAYMDFSCVRVCVCVFFLF